MLFTNGNMGITGCWSRNNKPEGSQKRTLFAFPASFYFRLLHRQSESKLQPEEGNGRIK